MIFLFAETRCLKKWLRIANVRSELCTCCDFFPKIQCVCRDCDVAHFKFGCSSNPRVVKRQEYYSLFFMKCTFGISKGQRIRLDLHLGGMLVKFVLRSLCLPNFFVRLSSVTETLRYLMSLGKNH